MAKLYANLVRNNLWAVEDVPTKWRAEVERILNG